MIRLTLLLLFFSCASHAKAEELAALHSRATELASSGRCEGALDAYRELARAGVEDANVDYDRALCHAQEGQLGEAIVWLERARLLEPSDLEIRQALRRAEGALRQEREADNQSEPLTIRESVFSALTAQFGTQTLSVLALLFQALAFGAVGVLFHSRSEKLRIALGLVSSFSFVLFLVMLLGIGQRLEWFSEGRLAVVVADEATLRAGPDDRAPGRRIVREGDRLRVLDERRGFAEVRLPDDQRGFVRASEVQVIRARGSD